MILDGFKALTEKLDCKKKTAKNKTTTNKPCNNKEEYLQTENLPKQTAWNTWRDAALPELIKEINTTTRINSQINN